MLVHLILVLNQVNFINKFLNEIKVCFFYFYFIPFKDDLKARIESFENDAYNLKLKINFSMKELTKSSISELLLSCRDGNGNVFLKGK